MSWLAPKIPPAVDLWDQAYEGLRNSKDKHKLIEAYEDILLSDARSGVTSPKALQAYQDANLASKRRQMSHVLARKVEAMEAARAKLKIGSKELDVGRALDRTVECVLWAKEFVADSVSAEPHAALAWTGICVVLPLLLNHSTQRNAAIEGLDAISAIIKRSKVVDETHRDTSSKSEDVRALKIAFQEKRKNLYGKILQYEARMVCHFSSRKLVQVLKDLIKYESWTDMLADIVKQDGQCDEDRKALGDNKLEAMSLQLNEITDGTKKILLEEQQKKGDKEVLDVLNWVSTVNHYGRHIDIRRGRLDCTGNALFEKTEFKSWEASDKSSMLWVLGGIGVGKTMLMSRVIDDVLEKRKTKEACAYFYCDFSSLSGQILCSIVRQLSYDQNTKAVHETVSEEFAKRNMDGNSGHLRVEECTKLLINIIAEISVITIVIDALDELQSESRGELLANLREIVLKSQSPVKILLSGRNSLNISSTIETVHIVHLDINDNRDDIKRYVHRQIAESLDANVFLGGNATPELQSEIADSLLEGAEGMFQWVKVQFGLICDSDIIKGEDNVREQLNKLPKDLDDSYSRIMEDRVGRLLPSSRMLVKRSLTWLLSSKRDLNIYEFLALICVDADGKATEVRPEDIVGYSFSLILVDHSANRFRIAHASIGDYLRGREDFSEEEMNTLAAERCMAVWLACDPKSGVCNKYTEETDENDLINHYAATFLVDHLEKVWPSGEILELHNPVFKKFFSPPSRLKAPRALCAWMQAIHKYHQYVKYIPVYRSRQRLKLLDFIPVNMDDKEQMRAGVLFVSAHFGLVDVVTATLRVVSDVFLSVWHNTPIQIAAKRGKFQTVRIQVENQKGNTPTDQVQPTCAHTMRTKELWPPFEREAEPNETQFEVSNYDCSKKGGSVDSRKFSVLNTALGPAIRAGHEEIVYWLLDQGACPDAMQEGACKGGVLMAAVETGNENLVMSLVDRGATVDIAALDYSYRDAVGAAAALGQTEIAEFLLSQNPDLRRSNALSKAVGSGNTEILKLLLERDFPQNAKDEALLGASANGHLEAVKLLLQNGADHSYDSRGKGTAIRCAITGDHLGVGGHLNVVEFLLEAGADINNGGTNYYKPEEIVSPIGAAVEKGSLSSFFYLLEKGADTTRISQNDLLQNAIYADVPSGDDDSLLARMLFERFPDLARRFKEDKKFSGEYLDAAVVRGNSTNESSKTGLVRLFLENGADPMHNEEAPIWHAIERSELDMLVLLNEFAKIYPRTSESDGDSKELRILSSRTGHQPGGEEVAEWLLDKGVDAWFASSQGIPLQRISSRKHGPLDPALTAVFLKRTGMPRERLEVRFDEFGRMYYLDHLAQKSIWSNVYSGYPETWQQSWTTTGNTVLIDEDTKTVIWRDASGKHLSAALQSDSREDAAQPTRFLVVPNTSSREILSPNRRPIPSPVSWGGPTYEQWSEAGYRLKLWPDRGSEDSNP